MSHSRIRRFAALVMAGVLWFASPAVGQLDDEDAATARAEKRAKELEIARWYPSAEAGVTLTQSSYSQNWYGGEKSSFVWTAIFNGGLENKLSSKLLWSNQLKLAFGQTHQQDANAEGNRYWSKPDKSTDLIDFESLLLMTLGGLVDPYVSGRLESQFQGAPDTEGRVLALNPLQLKESAGIARHFFYEEDRVLLSRLGFTVRENLRRAYDNPPPDDATTMETTVDGGLEWVTDLKRKILDDRILWTSKLGFYQPFFYSAKSDFDDLTKEQLEAAGIDPDVSDFGTAIDIDWENILTTQITKVLSVSLYARWVYDKYDNSVKPLIDDEGNLQNPAEVNSAIRKAGQFKETLSIGLTWTLL